MVTQRFIRTISCVLSLLAASTAIAAESSTGDGPRSLPTQADKEEAQQRYKRGVEQFKNGVYDAALIEFRRAYALAPSYKILYNIGQVSRQLDDYASAVDAFRRYLREGGTNISAARETEVKAELDKLAGRVGTLDITVTPDQAEITVDDLSIGKAPVRGALVNAGRRRIGASLPGYPSQSRVVDLAGGEAVTVTFDFAPPAPEATKPVAAQSTSSADPKAESSNTQFSTLPTTTSTHSESPAEAKTPWLWWSGAAILAAGATTTGILSLQASRDIDDLKRKPAINGETYDRTHSRMFGYAVATDVLTGLAVATGAVALYFTLSSPKTERVTAVGISPTGVEINCVF